MTVHGATEVRHSLAGSMMPFMPKSVFSTKAMAVYALAVLTLMQPHSTEATFVSAGLMANAVVGAGSLTLLLHPATWLVASAAALTGLVFYQTIPTPDMPSDSEDDAIAAELGWRPGPVREDTDVMTNVGLPLSW